MAKLNEKKADFDKVQTKFQVLHDQLNDMQKKKKDLEDNIENCSKKLDRAEKIINGLGGEKTRWTETVDSLKVCSNLFLAKIIISKH